MALDCAGRHNLLFPVTTAPVLPHSLCQSSHPLSQAALKRGTFWEGILQWGLPDARYTECFPQATLRTHNMLGAHSNTVWQQTETANLEGRTKSRWMHLHSLRTMQICFSRKSLEEKLAFHGGKPSLIFTDSVKAR